VGFELEMAVLTDLKGRDPGYGTKLHQGRNFDLTVDHDSRMKPMTEAGYQYGESTTYSQIEDLEVLEPYTSIVELVTKPVDETAGDAAERFSQVAAGATLFAKNVAAKTNGLNQRVPLAQVVPSALPDTHVGFNAYRYGVEQAQSLDANFQATLGVDLAQLPALLTKIGQGADTTGEGPLLAEPNEFIAKQELASAGFAAKIVEALIKAHGAEIDLEQAQNLANLQGLMSLMLLYLRTAALWADLSTKDPTIVGKMSIKNFTPFLSHTDLGALLTRSLTLEEQLYLYGRAPIAGKLLLAQVPKGLGVDFNPDLKMLKWGAGDRFGPTSKEFVTNVLSGAPDGVTGAILPKPKQMGPESVGPERPKEAEAMGWQTEPDPENDVAFDNEEAPPLSDLRRQAPVIELRSLANKLGTMQSGLGTTKFPPEAWTPLMAEIFYTVRKLSLAGAKTK